MTYSKAYLFHDNIIADKILLADDPKEQKALGRQISNFDPKVWDSICEDVVYLGNALKFGQHGWLLNQLKSTAPKLLAEASPHDSIWGIGMCQHDAEQLKEGQTWPGQNKLGNILTNLRDTFIEEPTAVERKVKELYVKLKERRISV